MSIKDHGDTLIKLSKVISQRDTLKADLAEARELLEGIQNRCHEYLGDWACVKADSPYFEPQELKGYAYTDEEIAAFLNRTEGR